MAEANYYQQSRSEMLRFLPGQVERLLDIGCSSGFFAQSVKARFPNCETWGVEPVASVAAEARARVDHVLDMPLEQCTLPDGYFDIVTMNDVLEHFAWPEPVLATVRRVMRPGGKLILSLPNVAFYGLVRDLVFENDWRYADDGILDRTHFRFYTAKSAARLVEQAGFRVDSVTGINYGPIKLLYKLLLSLPRLRWMKPHQFAIVASRTTD